MKTRKLVHWFLTIESLRSLYSKLERTTNELRKAARNAKKEDFNYSFDEMCTKYKMTRKKFSDMPVTYDYTGHYLPLWENENKIPPFDNPKLKFNIKENEESNLILKKVDKKSLINQTEITHVKDNIYKELSMININPTYGVKYCAGREMINGSDYDSNPSLRNTQMSLKKYYAICGIKTPGKSLSRTAMTLDKTDATLNNTLLTTQNKKQSNQYISENSIEKLPYTISASNNTTRKYYKYKTTDAKNYEMKNYETKGSMIKTYYGFQTFDLDNDYTVKRNAMVTPDRSRPNTRIKPRCLKRLRASSFGTKHGNKLAPPPLGMTIGHGVFNM